MSLHYFEFKLEKGVQEPHIWILGTPTPFLSFSHSFILSPPWHPHPQLSLALFSPILSSRTIPHSPKPKRLKFSFTAPETYHLSSSSQVRMRGWQGCHHCTTGERCELSPPDSVVNMLMGAGEAEWEELEDILNLPNLTCKILSYCILLFWMSKQNMTSVFQLLLNIENPTQMCLNSKEALRFQR